MPGHFQPKTLSVAILSRLCYLQVDWLDYTVTLSYLAAPDLWFSVFKRFRTMISKHEHISLHLASLHWLPVDSCIKYTLACICYTCTSTNSPPYLSDLLTVYPAARHLRSSSDNSGLRRPSVRTVSYGQRYSAPSTWNSLPQQVRSSDNVSTFRSQTKTHLFRLFNFFFFRYKCGAVFSAA